MTVGELLYGALGFHVEDDASGDLEAFCTAWAAPLELVYLLVKEDDDGGAGWSLALDADEAPEDVLAWLSQFVGVIRTPEMSTEQLRAEIKEPTGWSRGREGSVRLVAARGLTGTQHVVLKPRTPEVWNHYVRTLASETPNPAATEANIRAALPAWEKLDYDDFEAFTYADLKADVADYAAAKAKYATYGDIVNASL